MEHTANFKPGRWEENTAYLQNLFIIINPLAVKIFKLVNMLLRCYENFSTGKVNTIDFSLTVLQVYTVKPYH